MGTVSVRRLAMLTRRKGARPPSPHLALGTPPEFALLAKLELLIALFRLGFVAFPTTAGSPRLFDAAMCLAFVLLAALTWSSRTWMSERGLDLSLAIAAALMGLVVGERPQDAGQVLGALSLVLLVLFAAYHRPPKRLWPMVIWTLLVYGTALLLNPRTGSPLFFAVAAVVLVVVARVVSVLVGNLRSAATRDSLTGALNRNGLSELFHAVAAVSARSRSPVTVGMIDMDRFKAYNDAHGHHAGDMLLVEVSQKWQEVLRDGDLLSRIGGDEFAVVLPHTTVAGADNVIARMRAANDTSWTVGLTQWEVGEDLWNALGRADTVMYELKDARPGGGSSVLRAREAVVRGEQQLQVAKERLDASHLQLRAVIDTLLDPHVLLDAIRDENDQIVDFVYVDANDAACEYNRMTREQLVGARLLNLLPGHSGTGLLAMYSAVVESGQPLVLDDYSYWHEILASERRYDIRAVRVGDALSYTWRDVTERHASVAALAKSERRYRLLAAVNALVATAQDEGELLGDICAVIVEQGGYQFARYVRQGADAEGTDVLTAGDLAGVAAAAPDGLRSSTSVPVTVDGAIDGALWVYAEQTDAFDRQAIAELEELATQLALGLQRLRRAGQLLQAVARQSLLTTAIDQAAETFVVTDPTPAIIYANPAAIAASGYSLDELVGQNPSLFSSGQHDHAFYVGLWADLLNGRPWHGVLINRRKNGEVYEEDATIAPVHDAAGTTMAYVAVKHDLSITRGLEADLIRERSDRAAVRQMVSGVQPGELKATADSFCEAVVGLDGFDSAIVLLTDPSGYLIPIGCRGPTALRRMVGEGTRIPYPDGFNQKTDVSALTVDGATPSSVRWLTLAMVEALLIDGFTAVGCAPLVWRGEVGGLVAVATRVPVGVEWMQTRLGILAEFGSLAGVLFGAQAEQHEQREAQRAEIRDVIDAQRFHPVFQPVVDLATGRVRGYEALTRFDGNSAPDQCFANAHLLALGDELETACVAAALVAARGLPADVWLSVNFSPEVVLSGHAARTVADASRPIVIELTEHLPIGDYPLMREAIQGCTPARISVDDAGAGFASLRHILELQPDMVKLDAGLIRGIDADPVRQALTSGMCHFARTTGTILIAEGVEAEAEAETLRGLGVELAQGYLFGRPVEAPGGAVMT
ncbi:MAG: EAL domain-containing protein [Actinobacteria bacterium]|uniref:Unannotated protein n=2 Tax=freshwater metagenome TaxID=449393 RepID=A0A6J7K8A0_9ZZZZ|nr:EAL domain-containing protein [Actinomycetota bacterium]MSW78830.1 EAL domain-containing protein [Actinomycetota bacterium]MSZ83782.1 EAL domain-containing protein [Actinomycetota bacterium]MTB18628.1 EAL domain-containing protein [Actinomycetota bacterium]